MGRVNSEAAALLVAGICRGKFWASPEETERWLKTETGQRIAALIEKERRKHKNEISDCSDCAGTKFHWVVTTSGIVVYENDNLLRGFIAMSAGNRERRKKKVTRPHE